ncbi:MAG TPA: hypothetical protein PLN33_16205 [Hyphomonadaceae bacterium]|nr:hypothetical protein [Hyphomonadaceae bacterium]HPN07331.1 hypothetical protein [Hyphomonadaceae bacterium]
MDGFAAQRTLNILAVQDRYNTGFNTPRVSRHTIERRKFLPFNRVYEPLAGATMVNPWPPRGFDLLHAFNRVPLGPTPFVIGFESHMPRAFGREGGAIAKTLTSQLLSKHCRRIVPMSQAAKTTFLQQHQDNPRLDELKAKMVVRLPNIMLPEMQDWFDPNEKMEELRVLFVGGHFARKGGIVGAKLAKKARAAGLPIHVTIVSVLDCNAHWIDPSRGEFFEPYIKMLDAPNVTFYKGAPNAKVLELAKNTHLSLLATLGDTFGYSAIEGMSRYTPVIGTSVSALPEFIDNENGIMLPLETNSVGEWKHVARPDRDTPEFEKVYADTLEDLAEGAFKACAELLANPAKLAAKRQAARRTVEEKFDGHVAGHFWDELYTDAVNRR